MLDWWLENGPPTYVLVAMYMGYKGKGSKPKSDKSSSSKSGNLNELFNLFPGGSIQ